MIANDALVQRLGIGIATLGSIKHCQIVQRRRDIGMIGTKRLFVYRQRALVERLGIGIATLVFVQHQPGCSAIERHIRDGRDQVPFHELPALACIAARLQRNDPLFCRGIPARRAPSRRRDDRGRELSSYCQHLLPQWDGFRRFTCLASANALLVSSSALLVNGETNFSFFAMLTTLRGSKAVLTGIGPPHHVTGKLNEAVNNPGQFGSLRSTAVMTLPAMVPLPLPLPPSTLR